MDEWRCTICSKVNDRLDSSCKVCCRPFMYLNTHLPFHPAYKPLQGASKGMVRRDVLALLEAGADPDQKDSTGWTGSHWAVAMSRIDLLELYIDFGADINKAKTDGKTPLHIACEIGDAEMVLFLLQRGVDLESRAGVDGYTPLHLSTKGNFKECIEVLALAGADINASTLYGKQTPLHVACVMGHYESVLSLINVSHDPIRVCRGYEQLLIDAEDADGWSPYAMAQFKKHQRIIDLLDSAGSRKRSTGLR